MRVKLASGIEVKVDRFSFGFTYGGLLEGSPNEQMNRNIFERTSYPENWGPRKVLKIQPEPKEFETELKPCDYVVWLTSLTPIESEYHGSELVVIWFDLVPGNRPIQEIIESGVRHIDWNAHAQDFYY